MKFVQDFYFADWRVFEVCGNKFLWSELTETSAGNSFLGFYFQVARLYSNFMFSSFFLPLQGFGAEAKRPKPKEATWKSPA